jgi:hypothetical protein
VRLTPLNFVSGHDIEPNILLGKETCLYYMIGRVFQNRPNFLKKFEISRCNLDEALLVNLWEGLHEQRGSLEELDTSYNPGRIDASKIAYTLNEASRLKRLNLAYTIRGNLEGPLFRPWSSSASFEAWRLEDLDLSGWKVRLMAYYCERLLILACR